MHSEEALLWGPARCPRPCQPSKKKTEVSRLGPPLSQHQNPTHPDATYGSSSHPLQWSQSPFRGDATSVTDTLPCPQGPACLGWESWPQSLKDHGVEVTSSSVEAKGTRDSSPHPQVQGEHLQLQPQHLM